MLAMALMILLPLAMALLLLVPPLRPVIARALGLAPVPGLLLLPSAWNGGVTTVTLPGGWIFVLDQPGALMLAASTLLWIFAGGAASRRPPHGENQANFALWWLLTLCGSLGVFLAGDVVSFYALYALASLPAYGLISFSGRAEDRRAGRITLAAALVGEGLILAAFAIMAAAAEGQGLAIAAVMHALPQSAACSVAIAMVVMGFGLKIGLVPLHGWMPLSYAAGPLAATAVLSGATSKAGLIGLIRFLPLDTAMPVAGGIIVAAGLVSALYGAVLGLTQSNPRSVLAYSSISQLGQLAAVLGAGLAAGRPEAGVIVAYYAVYHVLVKGALFLMLASLVKGPALPKWQLGFAAFSALGFAGVPLSGGALGKLAFKDVAGTGATGLLLSLAAIGSTLLMLHFLSLVRTSWRAGAKDVIPSRAWIATGVAAWLLQWTLFAAVTGAPVSDALQPGAMIEFSWPVLAGAILAFGLAAAGTQAPHVAPGDSGARAIARLEDTAARLASLVVRAEDMSRQWPASTLALSAAAVAIVALTSWLGTG